MESAKNSTFLCFFPVPVMTRHSRHKMWWCSTSLTFDIQDNSASHATPPHHTCLERLTTPCLIWHTLFLILFLTVVIPLTSSPPHMLSKLSLSSATIFVFTKAAKVCTHVLMRKRAFFSFSVGSEGVCVCMSVRPLFFFSYSGGVQSRFDEVLTVLHEKK
jgi:hypothetical protein